MIEKLYKIVYWIFLIESILILIGINLDIISYGIDIQTPFMAIGIFIGLVFITILRLSLKKLTSTTKKTLGIIIISFMIFLCFYYLLEDQFQISING